MSPPCKASSISLGLTKTLTLYKIACIFKAGCLLAADSESESYSES